MVVEDLALIQTKVMAVVQEVIVLVLVSMVSTMESMVASILMAVVEQVLDNLIKTLADKATIEGDHNLMQQVRIQQQRKLKNLPNNCSMYLHHKRPKNMESGVAHYCSL